MYRLKAIFDGYLIFVAENNELMALKTCLRGCNDPHPLRPGNSHPIVVIAHIV